MVNIIKEEIEIEESLESRLRVICDFHKIILSAKYVKTIENMENKSFLILEELQFHLQNLTSDIQNISYLKMFNGLKVEKDESDKYNQISLNKKRLLIFQN